MHQKIYAATVMCICLFLAACIGCGNKADSQRFNIDIPSGLTKETADLTVTGTSGVTALLDLTTIRQLPSVTFETYDPWDEKRERFTGVPVYKLLRSLDMVEGADHIIVIAENGYEAQIKISDLKRYEYILAYMIDGITLGESEELIKKGNLIIAINFDKYPDMAVEIYKYHLVWQVAEIAFNRDR